MKASSLKLIEDAGALMEKAREKLEKAQAAEQERAEKLESKEGKEDEAVEAAEAADNIAGVIESFDDWTSTVTDLA